MWWSQTSAKYSLLLAAAAVASWTTSCFSKAARRAECARDNTPSRVTEQVQLIHNESPKLAQRLLLHHDCVHVTNAQMHKQLLRARYKCTNAQAAAACTLQMHRCTSSCFRPRCRGACKLALNNGKRCNMPADFWSYTLHFTRLLQRRKHDIFEEVSGPCDDGDRSWQGSYIKFCSLIII